MSQMESVSFRIIENHPNDSRVQISKDNTFQALTGRMGTGGGNVPLIMEDHADARTQDQILRLLQETYGAEKVVEWGIAVMASLQQAEVLQSGVYESCIQGEAEDRDELDDSTLPRPKLVAKWVLRDMREQSECRRSSQGWKSAEQFDRQFAEIMSELSHERTQPSKALFDMWRKGKGIWVLQQTLYQIQEVWQSSSCEWKGGDGMNDVSNAVVRRLTPL